MAEVDALGLHLANEVVEVAAVLPREVASDFDKNASTWAAAGASPSRKSVRSGRSGAGRNIKPHYRTVAAPPLPARQPCEFVAPQ